MFVLWILAIFCLLLYIYNRATKNLAVVDRMFPGPRPLPFLGNALEMWTTPEGLYQKAIEWPKRYNYQFYRLWIFHRIYMLAADCDTVQTLLTSNKILSKARDYGFFYPWLREGIFTADGPKWKSNRKLMTPAFHFKILQSFQDVFYKNAVILANKYLLRDGQGSFDTHEYDILYAVDNICDSAMGTSIQAQSHPDSAYVKAVKNLVDIIYKRTLQPWYRSDFIFNWSRLGRLQRESLKVAHKFTIDVILKRKEERKKIAENPKANEDEDLDIKKRNAFLDLMLDAAEEGNWSDIDLRAEVDSLLFGGHDTIGCALDFIFYNISQHQDIQEKICEELRTTIGEEERGPTYQELQSMKYTERVIKESLRLHPPVMILGRYVTEDFPLGDGRYIPAGVDAGVNVVGLHQNPNIYENPSIFDPDRWTPENIAKRHPFSYLPFSAGSRNCLGQKFAMMELKITIASVLRKVRLLPCQPEERPILKAGIILSSANGVNLKVRARSTPYGI